MRFRKLAGLVVGALTVGALAGPGLVAPAQAAAQTTESFLSSVCKYSNFYADYRSDYDVVVDGTNVSVTFDSPFNPGATASNFATIQFKTITPTMVLNIDGQAVTVSAVKNFADVAYGAEGAVMGNTDLAFPTLTGTLAEADPDVAAVSLTSMTIPMKISVNPAVQNVNGSMTCTPDKMSTLDVSCTYQAFTMFYAVKAYTGIMNKPTGGALANGQYVRSYLANPFVPGMPGFLSIDSQTSTLGLTVDSEALSLTGTQTYSPALPGNSSMPVAKLAGTRTATAALTATSVDDFDTSLSVGGSPNAIGCAPYVPTVTTATSELTCVYSSFLMPYSATMTTTYDRKNVTASFSDVTFGQMPSSFLNHSIQETVTLKAGTTPITLTSPTVAFETPVAGNATMDVPNATGTSDSVLYPAATTIDLVTFVVKIKTPFGNPASPPVDTTIKCGVAASTVTTLTATSTTPNSVGLSAAVDKTAAPGTVTFYEGATKVGDTTPVAAGIATSTLSDVPAGPHSYTAKFTPTEQYYFVASTSPVSAVTVAPATTATTLGATSAAANAASLAATVSPDTAGNVEFYEGATKVGEAAAAAGKAALALTGVTAGQHTYTAKFVPTDSAHFGQSTSAPATVTVAAPGPSAACVKADGAATSATAAVKAATTKVKGSTAKVKTATAKVKKLAKVKTAKGKKQLKAAKKALKAAQTKLKADTKKLDTAKKALTTANNAVKAAC